MNVLATVFLIQLSAFPEAPELRDPPVRAPPPGVRPACLSDLYPALRTLGGGGGVEAAGDEEHAESVVVVVAEAAGDAAGEFDEAVHGLGAAVG